MRKLPLRKLRLRRHQLLKPRLLLKLRLLPWLPQETLAFNRKLLRMLLEL